MRGEEGMLIAVVIGEDKNLERYWYLGFENSTTVEHGKKLQEDNEDCARNFIIDTLQQMVLR
jgi:hypothetical protein